MREIVENQFFIRLIFSLGGLLIFWCLALLFPFRTSPENKNKLRWLTNLALSLGNAVLISLLVPIALYEISTTESLSQWGLLRVSSDDWILQIIFGILVLDLVIYWQHRFTHKIPILWRLHRVHHSDIEIDTTTAGRFHTLEILMSFFVKAFFIVLFGIPGFVVILFEVLLNFSALFNHSNFQLPRIAEKPLRHLIITPDLHRIHHSIRHEEMNRNFGFSISLWDRLFNSFLSHTVEDPKTMKIGLNRFRSKPDQNLIALILQPFLKNQQKAKDHRP